MAARGIGRERRRRGFTLIEILAVVAILALMSAFVIPNLGALTGRSLGADAQQLAAQLELGRQRAIVTGVTHRMRIDLDRGVYRLEWLAADPEAAEATPPAEIELQLAGESPLPLAAPRAQELEFRPLPGQFGNFNALDDDVSFAGLETPEGWIETGESSIVFDRDGTASYTEIVLDHDSGESLVLEVLPLADAVRIHDAAL